MPGFGSPASGLIDFLKRFAAKKLNGPRQKNGIVTARVTSQTGSQYVVDGHTIGSTGRKPIPAGSDVAVAYRKGKPLVILAHTARRAKFSDNPFLPEGGIVEELFIADNPDEPGTPRDVWFRNDQILVPLNIRGLLPSDPTDVRWGVSTRHFVVQTGDPTAQDLIDQAAHPQNFLRVVKQYHVFEITNTDLPREEALGANDPEVSLLFTHEPYSSALVLFQLRVEFDAQERHDRQKPEVKVTVAADPTPISGSFAEGTFNYVTWDYGLAEVAVATIEGPGSTQVDVTIPHDLAEILNGVNEDNRLWFGDIEDFGLDIEGELVLSVRGKFFLIQESTAGADVNTDTHTVIEDSVVVPCTPDVDTEGTPPSTVDTGFGGAALEGNRTRGEAHLFVVRLRQLAAPQNLYSTTGQAPRVSTVQRSAQALGVLSHFQNFTGSTFPPFGTPGHIDATTTADADTEDNCSGGAGTEVDPDDLPGGIPFEFEYTDFYANGIASRRMTLFNPDGVPFITTPVVMTATELAQIEKVFAHPHQDLSTENAPAIPSSINGLIQNGNGFPNPAGAVLYVHDFGPLHAPFGANQTVMFTTKWNQRNYTPAFIWTYRIRRAKVLDLREVVGQTQPPVMLVVDRVRVATVTPDLTYDKEVGAFLINRDGTLEATLFPFTSSNPVMDAGDVADEFVPDLFDDGLDIEILTAQRNYILWVSATLAQRTAGTGTINLTSRVSGTTRVVGTDVTVFRTHDFRLLNLDLLYAAAEDDRVFVTGWDPDTGTPSLDQNAEGFPPSDGEMEGMGALVDIPGNVVPDEDHKDYQAVNDDVILAGVGRDFLD